MTNFHPIFQFLSLKNSNQHTNFTDLYCQKNSLPSKMKILPQMAMLKISASFLLGWTLMIISNILCC